MLGVGDLVAGQLLSDQLLTGCEQVLERNGVHVVHFFDVVCQR